MLDRRLAGVLALALLAMLLAGCAERMPRAWREAWRGPDPTTTPRLAVLPAPTPRPPSGTLIPPAPPTALPTLTPPPTRTATATLTPTATPALAGLTLQEGTPWYVTDQFRPYDGTADTYISAWNRNVTYAGATSLSVRAGDIMAALIRFDLNDLPQSLSITSAEMSVYVSARSNQTPMTVTVRALLKPWQSATATWAQAASGLPWSVAGALGEADRSPEPTAPTVASVPGAWLTFDITDLAQSWLRDPESNYGVILNGEAPNAVQYDLVAVDARDERVRPRLKLTFATGAVALGPERQPTPTITATPPLDPFGSETTDLVRVLPIGSTVLARAAGDLTVYDAPDIVAAYRSADGRGVSVAVFTRFDPSSGYRLLWNSQELPGAAPVSLDIADLTGDGEPEILLSVTAADGAGRSLYVLTSRPSGYRLALPVGGSFDGSSSFGESGFEIADANNDGSADIIAQRAGGAETYSWDGLHFSIVR